MKVYVVTAGSYSDYHIKKCFLDKCKAEYYANNSGGMYGEIGRVEEYDISDNENIEVFEHGRVSCTVATDGTCYGFDVDFYTDNTGDIEKENLERTVIYTDNPRSTWSYSQREEYTIEIRRILRNGENLDEAEQRLQKVCYDISKQITILLSQGMTMKQASAIVSGK